MMLPDEFFRDCDRSWISEPALNIESARLKIRRIERAKRLVRENIDAENLEVIAGKIPQRDKTVYERRRRRNARHRRHLRKNSIRQVAGRRRDFQLRLARNQIDARGERPIRAVIRNLRGQINRHAKRHAQDIQQPEQRMPPQITQNVPAEDTKISFGHAN